MSTPTVSVLMPAYNAGRYVGEAVESVLSQSFGDLELVVVDDGSTDGTRAAVERLAAGDPRVRLYSRPNTGLIGARSDTLAMARGELVAFLDADDVALPGRLGRQVAYLREHPECVLVAGPVVVIDPDGDPLRMMGGPMGHEELERGLLGARGQLIYTSAVMTRRAAIERIGGFTPDTDPAEDLDLYLRLAEVGRIASLAEPVAKYREHLGKVGHTRAVRQGNVTRAILVEAHRRRGLEPPEAIRRLAFGAVAPADRHGCWAWWALEAGHVASARKHARAALARRPLSPASWRLLYCTLRGR